MFSHHCCLSFSPGGGGFRGALPTLKEPTTPSETAAHDCQTGTKSSFCWENSSNFQHPDSWSFSYNFRPQGWGRGCSGDPRDTVKERVPKTRIRQFFSGMRKRLNCENPQGMTTKNPGIKINECMFHSTHFGWLLPLWRQGMNETWLNRFSPCYRVCLISLWSFLEVKLVVFGKS